MSAAAASKRKRTGVRNSRKSAVLGTLAGWLIFLWCRLLRIRLEARQAMPGLEGGPVIFAHWHNRILALAPLYPRVRDPRRRRVVLTSASNDGAMLSAAIAVFGFSAVRGSASRRGAAALVGLVRALRDDGADVVITPDGPRGPAYQLHPGVIKLAQATGAPILPVHASYSAAWRLRTWDRFIIPKPFSKVSVVFDELFSVPRETSGEDFEEIRLRLETILRDGVEDLAKEGGEPERGGK